MKKLLTAFFTLSFMTGIAGFPAASMAQTKPEDAKKTAPAAAQPTAKAPAAKPADKPAKPADKPAKPKKADAAPAKKETPPKTN